MNSSGYYTLKDGTKIDFVRQEWDLYEWEKYYKDIIDFYLEPKNCHLKSIIGIEFSPYGCEILGEN